MKLYHGSQYIINSPEYGKGKIHNDYGQGFYCTEKPELAKEWACGENHDGYANIYELDTTDLKILDLSSKEFSILNWMAILLKNRTFRITNRLAKDAKEYIIDNFSVDTEGYDCIEGWRADDSYFAFAEDFLNNAISVKQLSEAMRLGKLGIQFVLISPKAFDKITFKGTEPAERIRYYALRMDRDIQARRTYLDSSREHDYTKDELYVLDIMREGIKNDDPRLR